MCRQQWLLQQAELMEEEEDEDDADVAETFGIVTVVNITERKVRITVTSLGLISEQATVCFSAGF